MNIYPTSFNNFTPWFMGYEKTFVMLKPDAFERKLDSEIMTRIETSGLNILREWEGQPPRHKIEGNYIEHKEKSFFSDWINFLTSGKIKAMVLGGDDAISKASELKKTVRADYAPGEKRLNLIHASDSLKDAEREIKNFFDVEV